jgi:undecaprenyl diphosphate synthase
MNFFKFFTSKITNDDNLDILHNLSFNSRNLPDIIPPKHIAIIMDGNARWAKAKNLPLNIGHKTGAENISKIVEACIELKIEYLTLYAFSAENWDRPPSEVSYLLELLENYLESEINKLIEKNIAIVVSGDLSKISDNLRKKIEQITKKTKAYFGVSGFLTLNIAFSYGSRQEIIEAVKKIILAIENKKVTLEQVNTELLSKNLYQPLIPDPDLLIRTAGDMRISNFLLWQLAYSELYFTKTLWPDFNKNHLYSSIVEFNKRERRYGKR